MKAGHICTCKSFVQRKLECHINKGEKELLRVNTERYKQKSKQKHTLC